MCAESGCGLGVCVQKVGVAWVCVQKVSVAWGVQCAGSVTSSSTQSHSHRLLCLRYYMCCLLIGKEMDNKPELVQDPSTQACLQ